MLIVAANVLTMADDARPCSGLKDSARRIWLSREFARRHFSIAGIQEARNKVAFQRRAGSYLVLGSAAHEGQSAVELWVLWKFVHHPRNLIIVHSGHRLLIAKLRSDAVLDIVVLHAPTAFSSPDALSDWWSRTSALVQQHADPRIAVFIMDVNASLPPFPGLRWRWAGQP